mgnify:CR=1 FL=1
MLPLKGPWIESRRNKLALQYRTHQEIGADVLQRLGVEEYPDVEFPYVVIATDYPGATPEVVETEVTRRIAEWLRSRSAR